MRSIMGEKKTNKTKNKSRTRRDRQAITQPPKMAAGMTVNPNNALKPIAAQRAGAGAWPLVKVNVRAGDTGPARPNALEDLPAFGGVTLPDFRVTPRIIDHDNAILLDASLLNRDVVRTTF
jgi:hypothetical protein